MKVSPWRALLLPLLLLQPAAATNKNPQRSAEGQTQAGDAAANKRQQLLLMLACGQQQSDCCCCLSQRCALPSDAKHSAAASPAALLLLCMLGLSWLLLFLVVSKREAETKWEQQPLDHFDPILQAEGHFWKQRYFEALYPEEQQQQQQQQQQEQRQVKETGPRPIFVYIGGEAELKPEDATTGHFATLLETFKADGYAVEHRFYGRSLPQPNAETDNLRWLTAEQALADLALFIENRRRERAAAQGASPQAIPVVVFGCSYPGTYQHQQEQHQQEQHQLEQQQQ
ncbi:hypothetical protein Emed_001434 [Eimeria media]